MLAVCAPVWKLKHVADCTVYVATCDCYEHVPAAMPSLTMSVTLRRDVGWPGLLRAEQRRHLRPPDRRFPWAAERHRVVQPARMLSVIL